MQAERWQPLKMFVLSNAYEHEARFTFITHIAKIPAKIAVCEYCAGVCQRGAAIAGERLSVVRISDQEAVRLQVLKAIRRAEPVSRTELVVLTGLAPTTITEIVAELVARGMLIEERAPVARGRPRMQLRLNPHAACVVGAFPSIEGSLTLEIVNIKGDSLYRKGITSLVPTRSIEEYAHRTADAILEAITAGPIRIEDIHSVGLGLRATVNGPAGTIHWLPPLAPQSVPIAAIVEQRLNLPVIVDTNANLAARCEHWYGRDRQVDDFALILLGVGIGFSRYVNGELWTGAHGLNPEFAHVKVEMEGGAPCICGARGCLTTVASIRGIVHRIFEVRGQEPPRVDRLLGVFHELAAEARNGDGTAREAFEAAGRALGLAVANLINSSDPGRVSVLATDPDLAGLMIGPFHAAVHENTLPVLRGRAPVQFEVVEEIRYALGAAALVLERLYRTGDQSRITRPASRAPSP